MIKKENSKVRWPSIYAANSDNELISAIRSYDGPLQNIEIKQLLLIAAAIAAKNELPYDSGIEGTKSEKVSYANLNSNTYVEYRQYISVVYYMTKAGKNVENMGDVTDMVRNFEDYAHRGLLYLKSEYLEKRDGESEFQETFLTMLAGITASV